MDVIKNDFKNVRNEKMKNIYLIFILIFTLYSCNDNNSNIVNQKITKKDIVGILYGQMIPENGAFVNGYISASSHWLNGHFIYQISGVAYIDSVNPTPVLAGDITASDRTLEPFSYDNAMYGYATLPSGETAPVFGDSSDWGFSGNQLLGIPSFSTSIYSVDKIELINSLPTGSTIDKDNNLTINWNSDNNNPKVYILVAYIASISNRNDTTLTDEDYIWSTETNDDGSYTISSSIFSNIPIGGIVQIAIGRVNTALYQESGKVFRLISLVTARTEYILSE